MEQSLLSILPNLSIGVISVLALVFVVIKFLKSLDERAEKHEQAMNERENALRGVEKDVRDTIVAALAQSTAVLTENTRILQQVINELNRK